jgi:ankyrin repeat protein
MVNNEGKTALDIANTIEDKAKRATIIKLLTAQKVNLKDGEDKAISTGEKTRKRKCVRKAPDNLNQHHANNLRFFALECNFLKVKELLEKGANPNWVTKEGDYSPIMLAVLSPKKDDYEKIEIIALLYKYGAKIDLKNFYTLFNNKLITKSLREDIKKLSTQDRENFSVDEFLESLQKPGREVFYSNPRKSPSSDVEPSNYRALVTKMSRSEGLG